MDIIECDRKFNLETLRAMAKEAGVSPSGNKKEICSRLVHLTGEGNLELLTADQRKLLATIDRVIMERTSYGMRQEVVKSVPCVNLFWSNGKAEWVMDRYNFPQVGEPVTLDANEILVYASIEEVDAILEYINPLPLYEYSAERKGR